MSLNFKVFSLVCALSGAALVLWVTLPHGLGYTYDSYRYLYAAESLYHQGILVQPDGRPFVEWPPLFPLLLASLHFFTTDLAALTVYFQALLFCLVILLSSSLINTCVTHPWLKRMCLVSIAFGTPLVLIYTFLWSETIFVFFLLLAIHILLIYQQSSKPWSMACLILVGMGLPLQRLVGIVVIGSIALLLLFSQKPFRKQILLASIFGGVACVPLIGWLLRNHGITGKFVAQHLSPPYTVLQNLARIHEVLTAWWLPDELPLALRVSLLYAMLVTLLYLVRNHGYGYKHLALVGIFSGYVLGLFVLATIFYFEPLDERLLAPAFIPATLLLFTLLDKALSTNFLAQYKQVFLYACLLALSYPIARTIKNSSDWRNRPPASATHFHNYFN